MADSGVRSALRNRDLRLLLGALTVSGSGDWLYNSALIAFVLAKTSSPVWIAAASIMRLGPQVLFGPLGGVIADRFDRRKVMVACDLLRAATMGLLALVAAADLAPGFALALVFVTTTLGTPFYPAVAAMTPSIVGERNLAAANALTKGVEHLAVALGPALGGLLLSFGSPALAFGANAASFLGSAALASAIRSRGLPAGRQVEHSLFKSLSEGIAPLRGSPTLKLLVGLFASVTFVIGQGFVLLPLLAERRLPNGVEGVGFLFTAIGVGGLLAAAPAARLASSARMGGLIGIAVLVASAPLVGLAFASSAFLSYLLLAVQGAGTIALSVLAITLLQRMLDRSVIGRIFALLHSLAVASIVVGTIVTPPVVKVFGLKGAFIAAGVMPLLVGAVSTRALIGLDALAARRKEELEPRLELLRGLGIFDGATYQALEGLAAGAEEVSFEPGDTVIVQGDEPDHLYIALEGGFEVLDAGRLINTMSPGDFFGEIGLMESRPRTATVRASTPARALRIEGELFLEVLSNAPSDTLSEAMLGRLAITHPSH